MIIIWTNFVELESSMLYTKIQPESFLGSGEDFQEFLPYMDMAAILLRGTIWINWQYPLSKESLVKSSDDCSSSFREEDI